MDVFVDALVMFLCFIGVLLVIIAFFAFVVFKVRIRGVTVHEGYYVAFKRQGGFHYGAMQFDGYHLEMNGTVVQDGFHLRPDGSVVQDSTAEPPNVPLGKNWHGNTSWILRWGGWIFYVYPFTAPAKYSDHNNPRDGFGGNIYVRLGDVAFKPHTTVSETTEKDGNGNPTGQHVGVNVSFTSKGRVVRPQYFLFRSPYNVVQEAVEDRQDGVLRALIYSGSVNEIQDAKGNGAALWTKLANLGLLEAFNEARNDWGLDIVKNSIVVKSVDFDPAYQAALKAESQEVLTARGERAKIFDPINLAMRDWVEARKNTTATPQETFEQALARLSSTPEYAAYEREAIELRRQALAGGGTYNRDELDINSAGQPANPDMVNLIAAARALGGSLNRPKK